MKKTEESIFAAVTRLETELATAKLERDQWRAAAATAESRAQRLADLEAENRDLKEQVRANRIEVASKDEMITDGIGLAKVGTDWVTCRIVTVGEKVISRQELHPRTERLNTAGPLRDGMRKVFVDSEHWSGRFGGETGANP